VLDIVFKDVPQVYIKARKEKDEYTGLTLMPQEIFLSCLHGIGRN